MENKRQFERIRGYFPLSYKSHTAQKRHSTLTRDLSLGGLRIITFDALPVKEELRLEIILGTEMVNAQGSVVWTKQSGSGDRFYSGIKFNDLPYETEKALERYISAG